MTDQPPAAGPAETIARLRAERDTAREQLATAQWHLEDQRGAYRIAADALDRFRDVLAEALGYEEENPGDDVLVAVLREHFGKTGPEPTRWRDFLTAAGAIRDQINAEHARNTSGGAR